MKITNAPDSSSLMATARSFGNYDLAAALADLIDNSIKAEAGIITIDFKIFENDVWVAITDDGCGMDGDTLIEAMKPASSHPESQRSEDDLGRFGWGLKSASLSQARILTTTSWQDNKYVSATWDIDDIEDWGMSFYQGQEALNQLMMSPSSISGTEVLWKNTDRLLDKRYNDSDSLTNLIAHAKSQLELIFHRYLSGECGKKLIISLNGTELEPRDPFMCQHPATQTMDPDILRMSNGSEVSVQPYVLPHFSKLSKHEQEVLGGAEGMVRNQGFYVYRKSRLIIYGTWFKLVPHGELSQLTRIKVDLPNSVDEEWKITVDKSGAQLPNELKAHLRNVVKKFNRRSLNAHRKKGVSIDRSDRQPVWHRLVKKGRIRYVINRDHPMIRGLIDDFKGDEERCSKFDAVMIMLESYFPTDSFIKDATSADSNLGQPPTSSDEFDAILKQCWLSYFQSSTGKVDFNNFLSFLKNIEPFASHWRYTEDYLKTHKNSFIGL